MTTTTVLLNLSRYMLIHLYIIIIIRTIFLQGAERKTRDEERRAAKRKMTATGRKKLDELYHPVTDRSEFYCMSDIAKPPVLFTPSDDIEKVSESAHHFCLEV